MRNIAWIAWAVAMVGLAVWVVLHGQTPAVASEPGGVVIEPVAPDAYVVHVPCPSEDSCTVNYYDGAWHIGPAGSAE